MNAQELQDRTTREQCAQWKALDAKHGTTKNSPLHHDNRCSRCRENKP